MHIRKVIGPDEFHEHTDDNAYTNVMAEWTLRRGIEIVSWLKDNYSHEWQRIVARTGLGDDEPAGWRDVADQLVDNYDSQTGLIEQFRGYYELEPVDLRSLEPRNTTMDVLLGWNELTRSQISKQADVVMLLFLLDEQFPPEVDEANFRFYEPRTSHDSSLSSSFHALAAARLGDLELAERYFTRASNIDLDFARGVTAAGGIHIAALGGMWQALVFGFGGMRTDQDVPRWEPNVPPAWGELRFPILWRGRLVRAVARGREVSVE
jgi:kojibiose phosphorylase